MSLHADALAVLGGWVAPTPSQERLRARYVDHLAAHDDGVWRTCLPDHLTAGMLVLSADGDQVLLNLHKKARRWFHFGGHLEAGDETLAGAALREAVEESGVAGLEPLPGPVQLDEHAVPFCHPDHTVHHLDVRYVARAPAGVRPEVSDESLDVRWWPVAALPDGLEPEMHELIQLAAFRWSSPPSR